MSRYKEYSILKYEDMKTTMSKKEYDNAIQELIKKGFIKPAGKDTYELIKNRVK